MEQIINHKGGLCHHKFLVCQEGFCSECMIHVNALKLQQAKPLESIKLKQRMPAFALAN